MRFISRCPVLISLDYLLIFYPMRGSRLKLTLRPFPLRPAYRQSCGLPGSSQDSCRARPHRESRSIAAMVAESHRLEAGTARYGSPIGKMPERPCLRRHGRPSSRAPRAARCDAAKETGRPRRRSPGRWFPSAAVAGAPGVRRRPLPPAGGRANCGRARGRRGRPHVSGVWLNRIG